MRDISERELPTGAGSSAPVEARPAASTILLRGEPVEVLFLHRSAASTFVPGSWVFPGGALDPIDARINEGDELDRMRLCAIRELFEETGIWIGTPLQDSSSWRAKLMDDPAVFETLVRLSPPDLSRLVWTSRWVTPEGVPKRYDTWFFLVSIGEEEATIDEREGVALAWLSPAEALERNRAGSLDMVFPTIRNLEAIQDYASAEELLSARLVATIPTTRPRLIVENGRKRIVLPDE